MKTETIIFDPVTPHPAPVNIAELLADIETVIKRHVILSDHAAAALAVWVLHTYTFEMRDTVAYVAIESPEKRCGKTTLLSVLAAMACKPLIASNITVGALFRSVHTCMPTLFIDEADTFMAGNSTMRGIINSGNTRRTAYVLRLSASNQNKVGRRSPSAPSSESPASSDCGLRTVDSGPNSPSILDASRTTQHDQHTDTGLKKYSCWCPKVIAMIGQVPDTIADRSIVVKMARKLTTETCLPLAELESSAFSLSAFPSPAGAGRDENSAKDNSRFEPLNRSSRQTSQTSDDNSPSPGGEGRGEGEFISAEARGSKISDIKARCTRFAADTAQTIARSPKIRGEGLNDRAADTFDPLFVIARLAGDGWEQKLQAAALALSSTADIENSGTGLILDILDLLIDNGREKIFSRDLVALLREGSVESTHSFITEHQISKMLRPYGIKPVSVRIGSEVRNGYHVTVFHDALNRYISDADKDARLQAAKRRWQLQAEAHEEETKIKALYEKMKPRIDSLIKEGKSPSEIAEMFPQLKQDLDMAESTALAAEAMEENNAPFAKSPISHK